MVSHESQAAQADSNDEQFRKLFVGGLGIELTTEGLKNYFEKFGDIVDCIVVQNPKTQQSKGFGFVTFKEAASVDSVQASRPHTISSKEVEVKRAMPRDIRDKLESHVTTDKLFVGSLRRDVTEDELIDYFSQFGKVESAQIPKSRETNDSRGFGFVNFADYDHVDMAILKRPHTIKGSVVDVRKGLTKEDMQKVRLRQQQQHQDYYYDSQQAFGSVNHRGGFGFYSQTYGGGPVGGRGFGYPIGYPGAYAGYGGGGGGGGYPGGYPVGYGGGGYGYRAAPFSRGGGGGGGAVYQRGRGGGRGGYYY